MKKKSKLTFLFLLGINGLLFGNNISQDSLKINTNDLDKLIVKVRNMPNIEFGKGISFLSQNEKYKLTFRIRMQNMLGFSFNDDFHLKKTDAQVKRLRLRFDGYIYSPKLTYSIQLGFSSHNSKSNPIRDAIIYYAPSPTWNIGFGQTKIKVNRAKTTSSGALQFADRSIVNSEFSLDRDFGFFGEFNKHLFKKIGMAIKASITTGEGYNWTSSHNSGFAYTGRIELFPLGSFNAAGDVSEGDLAREQAPKILIAGAYCFNDKASRLKGASGETIANGQTKNMSSYFIDFILKYKGFAFYTDIMNRFCHKPILNNPEEQYIYTGTGINVQTSYLFHSKWEIALRNSALLPNKEIQPLTGYKYHNQSTLGITRYIIGHNLKVQADASYNYKKGTSRSSYNPWEIRFQVELGF